MGRRRRRGIEVFWGFLPAALGVCCWGFRGAGGWPFALARAFRDAFSWRERCALWVRFCAGIRDVVFFCCASGLVFLLLRWHPRFAFVLQASPLCRQKKAANTANISSCLRAPKGSYASRGNHVTHVRCQRSCGAPHPLHAPALRHAMPVMPRPPRWQTVCRP